MVTKSRLIAKSESEFSTWTIRRLRTSGFLLRHENGGANGSHNRQDGDGVWRERDCTPSEVIDAQRVEQLMAEWGYDDEDIDAALEVDA